MRKIDSTIQLLIDRNKPELLDSHLKYGGVYLASINMLEDGESVEVELHEGSIAFSIREDEFPDEDVYEAVNNLLRVNGIGVYTCHASFEEAMDRYHGE